jgi:hypothetical protein
MSRSCVFLRGTPLTREHVIPRWLTSVLPEQAKFRGQDQLIVLQSPGHTSSEIELPHREVREPFNEVTVRMVCRNCNSGWMNAVEEAARASITKLARGEQIELGSEEAEALATWAVKTTLMAHLTTVEGASGIADVYSAFFAERKPPGNSVVWAAATGAEEWGLRFELVGALIATEDEIQSYDLTEPVNTVSATFGLSKLLLHVVLTARPSVSYPPLDEIHPGAVERLWPNPRPVVLPPPLWFVSAGAWGISRSFAFWMSAE